MTTANQAFRKPANSPAGREVRDAAKSAADTARNIGQDVSDLTSDAARKAGDSPPTCRVARAGSSTGRGAPPPMRGTIFTMQASAPLM